MIDLGTEPGALDPATTYDADGWSIIHSIYDSLVQFGPEGELEPLLAESFTLEDPLTYRVKLRDGITFHNGESLDVRAVGFSIAHIMDEATGSQVAGNFAVISEVVEVDELTVDLKLSAPAPWLPEQIAAWLAILPPDYAAGNDFIANPVGTGPYRFEASSPGDRITVLANEDYFAGSPKGQPVAGQVDYRFVADATTRVSDLLSGTAHVVRGVPIDQIGAVEGNGDSVLQVPIAGCAFIRIPTDVEPFSDVRVRQALNYAVDVQSIIEALLAGNGERLPNLFVPNGLGYDQELEAYPYDRRKRARCWPRLGIRMGSTPPGCDSHRTGRCYRGHCRPADRGRDSDRGEPAGAGAVQLRRLLAGNRPRCFTAAVCDLEAAIRSPYAAQPGCIEHRLSVAARQSGDPGIAR